MGAPATVENNGNGATAKVQVGDKQYYYFTETDAPEARYDGHHAQIYIRDFSGLSLLKISTGLREAGDFHEAAVPSRSW
jgi:hypothetical protein